MLLRTCAFDAHISAKIQTADEAARIKISNFNICMKLIPVFHYSISVPFQPPDNFAVTTDSSTSITARWQLPPADTNNGIIRGFKLFYKKKDSAGSENTEVFNGTTFTKTFTNLLKYTEYEFQVWAFSSAGDGPKSALLSTRTNEDGKLAETSVP